MKGCLHSLGSRGLSPGFGNMPAGGRGKSSNAPSFPLNKQHRIQEEDMVQQLKIGVAQTAS